MPNKNTPPKLLNQVCEVMVRMKGVYGLMVNLLYGTGSVRLWIKDVDFERGEIPIRDGKDRDCPYVIYCELLNATGGNI